MMKSTIAFTIAALFASIPVFAQEIVHWNYNGQAIAKGSPPDASCDSEGDTSIIIAGKEIDVIFTRMHLDLKPGGPLSDRKNCHIVIPVKIAAGHYLGRLDQKLNYSVDKTKGSIGLIESRAAFFDSILNAIKIEATAADSGSKEGTEGVSDEFSEEARAWCQTYKNMAFEGNLIVDIITSALRTDDNQRISLSTDGRWRAIGDVYACQP